MTTRFKWGKSVTMITVASVLILAVAVFIICRHESFTIFQYVFAGGISIAAITSAMFIPVTLSTDDDAIVIKRLIGRVRIPQDSIREIRPVEPRFIDESFRSFGNGLLWFGGRLRSLEGYDYTLYATNLKTLVYIKTTSKNYVISCPERDEFIGHIKNIIS